MLFKRPTWRLYSGEWDSEEASADEVSMHRPAIGGRARVSAERAFGIGRDRRDVVCAA